MGDDLPPAERDLVLLAMVWVWSYLQADPKPVDADDKRLMQRVAPHDKHKAVYAATLRALEDGPDADRLQIARLGARYYAEASH